MIKVLSIAGSDCSGGAGIQADIKTMSALGAYAMSVITAVTAQNTLGVCGYEAVSPQLLTSQIDCVMTDIPPRAIKIGMLPSAASVEAVANALHRYDLPPIVLDPVMVSTSGHSLLAPDTVEAMTALLFPMAAIITPNVHEARALTGIDSPQLQARQLLRLGSQAVLVKGGDRQGSHKYDYLALQSSNEIIEFSTPTILTPNTHGTGCTLSSAIATYLARGQSITQAVTMAREYLLSALAANAQAQIGHGHGPVNHFFNLHSCHQ